MKVVGKQIFCFKNKLVLSNRRMKRLTEGKDQNEENKACFRELDVFILASKVHIGENKFLLVVYISLAPTYCTSSLVTRACNPSGDYELMGHWADLLGPGLDGPSSGLPIPSRELSVRTRTKACGSDTLRAEETA
ncbi:hypothetical protein N665_2407s0003 [Sinapis alba]|nr:hypothetical protein N665_2407s0003 [Sinapis alba]